MSLVRDWIVLTALRLINWLSWPWWLLALIGIGVIVVPPLAVYTYFWYVARILRASD